MWCRTQNQLIASECAIIDTTIFEMDCVSASFGTHDTTYYLDTFAYWKNKDLKISLENKKNGSTWSDRLGSYEVHIPWCDFRFVLYKSCPLYFFQNEGTHCVKSFRMRDTMDQKALNMAFFRQLLSFDSRSNLWWFLGGVWKMCCI